MECFTCRSISGEKRISPGPTIHEGRYWLVEHAYPCAMKGWLVLVLKRHVEALHEMEQQEFLELGELQAKVSKLLYNELHCEKEYSICFAEGENFNHIHFHLVARPKGLPKELRGSGVFSMLKVNEEGAVPRQEIKEVCEHLRSKFEQERQERIDKGALD